jgi:hypothetical protein
VTEGEEAQRGGKQANIIKADVSVKAGAKVSVTATRRLWQARYKYLLDAAKQLNADGHHAAAIVTAQTACEVCTAVVFTAVLRAKGVVSLTDPLRNLISSYSLANDKVRDLYVALSGDRIQDKPFWSDFKAHAKLRMNIVHGGHSATAEDADKSIATVEKVIDHLLQNRP